MSEPQPTDSTTDVMRYWVGLLRQLGEDVCTWMAVVEALKAQAERDRAVIEELGTALTDVLIDAQQAHPSLLKDRVTLRLRMAQEHIPTEPQLRDRAVIESMQRRIAELEAQAERDRAVIEAARAAIESYFDYEVDPVQRRRLMNTARDAIRLHDEAAP